VLVPASAAPSTPAPLDDPPDELLDVPDELPVATLPLSFVLPLDDPAWEEPLDDPLPEDMAPPSLAPPLSLAPQFAPHAQTPHAARATRPPARRLFEAPISTSTSVAPGFRLSG
jgi:hypothetical protein